MALMQQIGYFYFALSKLFWELDFSHWRDMRVIYLGVLFCCFVIAGCKKNGINHSQRCIYDHDVFAEVLVKAVQDEQQFFQFKRDPFFNLIWENHSYEEGKAWLKQIDQEYAFLKIQFERFRNIDQIGSPRVYPFGDAGVFSPSTLRLIAIAGQLRARLDSFAPLHIIQIGAGCGSLCKILDDVFGFKSYTLVDLPEQLALAKKCLEKLGVKHVQFCPLEQLPKEAVYDLVISDMSFSEFDQTYQELFFERIFRHSIFGYILGHEFPKHYGVCAMSVDRIKERFEKLENFKQWELQGPSNNRDYFIYWEQEVKTRT
jgi:putative sugar O-methyltransferase